jgi:hypothetical protein
MKVSDLKKVKFGVLTIETRIYLKNSGAEFKYCCCRENFEFGRKSELEERISCCAFLK